MILKISRSMSGLFFAKNTAYPKPVFPSGAVNLAKKASVLPDSVLLFQLSVGRTGTQQ